MVREKCKKCARRVPVISVAGNLALGSVKLIGAILSGSVGLTVDAFHSLSDAVGSIFVLASIRIAEKPRDSGHPYGHGKVEFLASLIVYTVLFGVGGIFFLESVLSLVHGATKAPEAFGAGVAMISVLANYIMLSLNFCAGGHSNRPALIANAHENLTDLISSIPVVVGIVAAQFGYLFADPLAALVVSLLIIANAARMWYKSLNELLDTGVSDAARRRIRTIAMTVEGVLGTGELRTRHVGQNLWADLGILVNRDLSVEAAREIADEVRGRLLRTGKHMEDVVVSFRASEPTGEKAAAP